MTFTYSDYSVYGSEFVSLLSSFLTYRILNDSKKRRGLEEYSYGQMMERLRRVKKIRIDKERFRLIRVNPSTEKILSDLGIVERSSRPRESAEDPERTLYSPIGWESIIKLQTFIFKNAKQISAKCRINIPTIVGKIFRQSSEKYSN